ncbi:MAG: hypothetical protein BWZ10_02567 [candidate division BRC1 bacterium ADurb.BinA364]|nr:MAG: hypothetical protein BWZ10_02567 [candidate division BRC1 bacterium ADurb.BinA364]
MRRWLALERQALSAADAMTAVSRNLALYYALAHSAARFPNPLIFPCAADTARFRLRESEREAFRARLGAAGKAVWIYAGSNAPYARLDLAARLLAAIERAAPGMSRYWILSRDWRAIRGTYLAAGVPEAAIHGDAAEHEQVAEWLAAADIGLLTRDRTLVSWVACPVKFAEYLACGLSVALAGPVGDLPEIARQLPASVLPPDGDIAGEEIQTLWRIAARHCEEGAGAIRLANRRMALERFSWEAHLPRLADLYAKMDEAD